VRIGPGSAVAGSHFGNDKRKFMLEPTRLAIEAVENGWGGRSAPAIVRDGGASLEDARSIGFDDTFQYEDFAKPWSARRIKVTADFERDAALAAFRTWESKQDRHPY
jgi:hypothetical protein